VALEEGAEARVWVDADACPTVIRQILVRAADRARCPVTFVANHGFSLPQSPYVTFRHVPAGFDVADHEIAQSVAPGDLVVTADVPLAAEAVERGALAVSPRGERFTAETARARLAMRDFMTQLRDSGVSTGGPAPLDASDRQRFANALDSWLARRGR
jgi:uncharacterized protein YaiI (UPF0178 family)